MKEMTRFLNALFLPKATFQALYTAGQPPVPARQCGQLLPATKAWQTTHCIVSGGTEQERASVLRSALANDTTPAVVLTIHHGLAGMLGCRTAEADPLAGKTVTEAAALLQDAADQLGYATAEWAFQLSYTLETLQELYGRITLSDFVSTGSKALSVQAFEAGDDGAAEAQCTSAARELERFRLALARWTPKQGSSAAQLLKAAPMTVLPVRNAAQAALLLQDVLDAAQQRIWNNDQKTLLVLDLGGALNRRQLELLHDQGVSSIVLDEDLPSRAELFQVAARGLTAGVFFAHQAGAQALSDFAGRCKKAQITTTTGDSCSESEWGGGPFGLLGNRTTTFSTSTASVLVDEPLIRPQSIRSLKEGTFYYYEGGRFRCCQF